MFFVALPVTIRDKFLAKSAYLLKIVDGGFKHMQGLHSICLGTEYSE